jgi:hypothetical protein
MPTFASNYIHNQLITSILLIYQLDNMTIRGQYHVFHIRIGMAKAAVYLESGMARVS